MHHKIAALISKYGLTLHGFLIASFIFPPAGAVIAWKMPRLPLVARLVMIAFCGVLLVTVPTLVAAAAYFVAHLSTHWFGNSAR